MHAIALYVSAHMLPPCTRESFLKQQCSPFLMLLRTLCKLQSYRTVVRAAEMCVYMCVLQLVQHHEEHEFAVLDHDTLQ
jgi:hypothetical protein